MGKGVLFATTALAIVASIPAAAQTSDAGGQGVSAADIVVTARRVEERLQDVPISITVFTPADIAKRNIVDPQDLVIYTPSLSSQAIFGRDNTTYAIRGFTQSNRTAASVAVYFADVVSPRSGPTAPAGDGAGPGQFFDLQSVQVLKGPQGTLFGRNTTGGAVLLVPQKPTGNFEGYVEGLYGNYNWKGLQGAVNVPLGDRARLRIAGEFQDRDGLTKNLNGGPDFDDRHYFALRASLVVDLTPDLENYTIVQYMKSENNGSGTHLIACDPSVLPLGQLYCGSPTAAFGREQADGRVHIGQGSVPNPFSKAERWGVINTTTYTASDTLTVKNIASYTQLTSSLATSIFGSPMTFPAVVNVPLGPVSIPVPTGPLAGTPFTFTDVYTPPGLRANDQFTFSEELQFQGNALEGKLNWQTGFYYEQSGPLGLTGTQSTSLIGCTNVRALQCFDALGAIYTGVYNSIGVPGPIPVGSVGRRLGTISYRNVGVYGQGTYSITDSLKLTAGLRYTWDRTFSTSQASVFRFPPGTGITVESCISPRAILANQCRLEYTQKSEKPTWLIGLDYNPTGDLLLYAKYARGYRQGATSADAAEGYQTFGPESVDAYEAGLKATFRGAISGVFNVAAFYNNLQNQQISAIFTAPPTSGISQADGIVNGGKSRIYGFEVDTTLNLFRGFTVSGGYTYLNTKLTSIDPVVPGPPYTGAAVTAVQGGELVYSPNHKFSGSATYRLPLDESVGNVAIGATYSYTDKQIASSASPFGVLPAYSTLNLNLDWTNVAGRPIDLSFFMTNALDEEYRVYATGLFQSTGFEGARYGDQRSYGVKLRYRFGN